MAIPKVVNAIIGDDVAGTEDPSAEYINLDVPYSNLDALIKIALANHKETLVRER